MSKQTNLFQKLDLFLFNKVEELKNKADYSKIQEAIGKIDDDFKDVAKIIATAVFLCLPLLFSGIVFMMNVNLNHDIEIRKEFIGLANEIISSNQQISDASKQIISLNPIEGQGGFNVRISQILSASGVDVEKIQVSNFISENIAGGIVRSEGDFRFSALTSMDLSNLFSSLVAKEKIKISTVSIRKNRKTNLLNGTFRVVHFSKSGE